MESYYGDLFKCKLPGIFIEDQFDKPVCSIYEAVPNVSLGLTELMSLNLLQEKEAPLLTHPPIGIYKLDSGCSPRCCYLNYDLKVTFSSCSSLSARLFQIQFQTFFFSFRKTPFRSLIPKSFIITTSSCTFPRRW